MTAGHPLRAVTCCLDEPDALEVAGMFRKVLVANRGEIAIRAFPAGYELSARAVAAAREAGLPVLNSSEPSNDLDTLLVAAGEIGFPLFVKAVAGGGGRGMRRVEKRKALRESIEAAMREAESAFGDSTVFLEQ